MDSLLEELECPVCTEFLTIPIRQCATGHSVCGKCITKLERCALCQDSFTDSRNLTLESLALKMKYPCSNKGCSEIVAYADREKHELRCQFKGFQVRCAMKGCDFVGDKNSIKNHWMSKKAGAKIFQTVNSSFMKLKNDAYFVNLIEGFGEFFWYKSKSFNNTVYFVVQFIGKSEEASKYYFEIEITKTGFPKKRMLVSDYCKSMELAENLLFKEDMCCTLGFGVLAQFVMNDNINYSLRLCRNKDGVDQKKNKPQTQDQVNKAQVKPEKALQNDGKHKGPKPNNKQQKDKNSGKQ